MNKVDTEKARSIIYKTKARKDVLQKRIAALKEAGYVIGDCTSLQYTRDNYLGQFVVRDNVQYVQLNSPDPNNSRRGGANTTPILWFPISKTCKSLQSSND